MKWLWWLIAAIVVALLIWWIAGDDDDAESVVNDTQTVEAVNADRQVNADAQSSADNGALTLATIMAQPQSHVGREFSGEVGVAGPITDRGFWVESDGARLFALVVDQPAEVPIDINAGQRLRIDGGTIRKGGDAPDVKGVPLDDDTLKIIADQDVFMVVNEKSIDILKKS
jgi:hypothetical protein